MSVLVTRWLGMFWLTTTLAAATVLAAALTVPAMARADSDHISADAHAALGATDWRQIRDLPGTTVNAAPAVPL